MTALGQVILGYTATFYKNMARRVNSEDHTVWCICVGQDNSGFLDCRLLADDHNCKVAIVNDSFFQIWAIHQLRHGNRPQKVDHGSIWTFQVKSVIFQVLLAASRWLQVTYQVKHQNQGGQLESLTVLYQLRWHSRIKSWQWQIGRIEFTGIIWMHLHFLSLCTISACNANLKIS